MDDSTPQEQPLQRLQNGSLQEGFVAPTLVRPAMEVKIVKPDERKGIVPPSIVQPAPSVPGNVPPKVIPPAQSQPPQHEESRKDK